MHGKPNETQFNLVDQRFIRFDISGATVGIGKVMRDKQAPFGTLAHHQHGLLPAGNHGLDGNRDRLSHRI